MTTSSRSAVRVCMRLNFTHRDILRTARWVDINHFVYVARPLRLVVSSHPVRSFSAENDP